MKKEFSTPFLGFLQATGLAFYLVLISLFFTYTSIAFQSQTAEFYAPIIMISMFIVSAVIAALLVLGKAFMCFLEKKYKEAVKLVLWTVFWIFLYTLFFMFILTL